MLGRFTAGLLAIAVMVFLSAKSMGSTEARRSENAVEFALQSFVVKLERSGNISKADYEELLKEVSLAGIYADVGIEIGTVIYGTERKALEVAYTDEVMEMLEGIADPYDLRGRLVTVYAVPPKDNLGVKLANLLWESYKPQELIVAGGYIHG